MFIAEFCAWTSDLCLEPWTVNDVTVYVHFPGQGSHCLAFAIRNRFLPSLNSVCFEGGDGQIFRCLFDTLSTYSLLFNEA